MAKIRVMIADDHALVRSGLRALLTAQTDMEVIGEATDGADVVEPCCRLGPDVVLMDLTMPGRGGIAATEELRRSCPRTKVLVVTMHEDECYARQAVSAGAAGYVLKKGVTNELIAAIRDVHCGKSHIAPSLAQTLAASDPVSARRRAQTGAIELLSPREKEVLTLLSLGHTNAEVATRLHISEKTIETHRMHIMEKLDLRTRADLVRFALEHGLMNAG